MIENQQGLGSGYKVVGVIAVAGWLLLMVGASVAAGWIYFTKHHARSQDAAAASNTPPTSVEGAVAALRARSTPSTQAQALALLEAKAAGGDAQAMVMTATCYRAGLGTVAEDPFKAFEWHRRAAEAGEPVAMVEMSQYYDDGVWVEADSQQSRQWLERAAAAGSAEAKWMLESRSQ